MMKNAKELKTTLVGLAMWIIGLVYFGLPYFYTSKALWEVNNIYLSGLVLGGIGLILAPDTLISIALQRLRKKAKGD